MQYFDARPLTPAEEQSLDGVLTGRAPKKNADGTWSNATLDHIPDSATRVAVTSAAAAAAGALAMQKSAGLTVNVQTGSTYTFALSDTYENGTALNKFTRATAVTVTFPKHSVVAFPLGHRIETAAGGAGKVTFAPVDADVVLKPDTTLSIAAPGKAVTWVQEGINEWHAYGALIA